MSKPTTSKSTSPTCYKFRGYEVHLVGHGATRTCAVDDIAMAATRVAGGVLRVESGECDFVVWHGIRPNGKAVEIHHYPEGPLPRRW